VGILAGGRPSVSRRPSRDRRAPGRSRRARGCPPWRRWFPVLAILVLLLLAPALAHAQADSLTLHWTAVGDDGQAGTAAVYDLRVAGEPITESSWDAATAVTGVPAPRPAGTAQEMVVRGLTPGATYWFALRVRDDAGNWSPLSNVVRWDGTLDAAPPAAPDDLTAEIRGDGIHLSWSPSASPDLAGYSVYRATSGAGPYVRLNDELLTVPEYQDDALPPGVTSPWYRVTASDASGNESAQTAAIEGAPMAASPALAWGIGTGWPNPSHVAETVRVPLDLVDGSARLDVCDAAGHLVRRLDLASAGIGHQVVEWDGRNDAGRPVAPGAYRAWLVAGDVHRAVRLLRIP
jgi:hypothetical protein